MTMCGACGCCTPRSLRRLSGVSPRGGRGRALPQAERVRQAPGRSNFELRKSGTGSFFALPQAGEFDREGLPPILKDFSAVAWSGPATGGSFAPYIWMMEFAVERLDAEVMPSFSLLCATRRAGSRTRRWGP